MAADPSTAQVLAQLDSAYGAQAPASNASAPAAAPAPQDALAALNGAYGQPPAAASKAPSGGISPAAILNAAQARWPLLRALPKSVATRGASNLATGLNAAADSGYAVLHHLANGADWLFDRSGVGPQINALTGATVFPSYADERAATGALQNTLDQAPQGGAPGALGHMVGTTLATLPFAEGALGAVGRGAEAAAPVLERVIPGASPFVRGIGNFLTGGSDASGALTRPLARGLSKSAAGALAGATAGAVSGNDPLQWSEGGALLGGGVGLGSGTGASVFDAFAPPIDAAHAALARRLMSMGVDLKGSDLAQSPFARFLYSNLSKVPFSGAGAATADTEASWNRALAHQIGENANRITPEVMGSAKARLGAGYDAIVPTLKLAPSDSLIGSLANISHEVSTVLPDAEAAPVQKIIDQVMGGFKDGNAMEGDAVHNMLKRGAPLSRMESSTDPNVRHYAGQVRQAINDELATQAPPESRASLQALNRQYKAMKTIEPLVKKSPTGDLSPVALMGQVAKNYPGMAYGEAGPMADLARGGQAFLKPPPSSGTAERELLFKLMGGLGGLGAGYEIGKGDPRALLAVPGVAVGARGIQKAMNSNAYRNALLRNSMPSPAEPYFVPPE